MSHMLADTEEELHAMASKIGMKRKWFQNKSTPHYDVCQATKAKALAAGALEIDRRQTADLIKKLRAERQLIQKGFDHVGEP